MGRCVGDCRVFFCKKMGNLFFRVLRVYILLGFVIEGKIKYLEIWRFISVRINKNFIRLYEVIFFF